MDRSTKKLVDRWQAAGVIDASTAGRIRTFEQDHAPSHASRFGRFAFAFGGLLLGAGVLLFVAANWDELSPWGRFALLAATVAVLHIGGAVACTRSQSLATTLHAVGTAALGGGIFLAGQVFNLAEHWPDGFLLWMVGAAAALGLLRDWPQALWVAILAPAWLMSEWIASATFQSIPIGPLLAGLFVLGAAYAAAVGPDRDATWRQALALLGAMVFVVVAFLLPLEPGLRPGTSPASTALLLTAWGLALGPPLALGALLRGRKAWPLLVLAGVAACAAHVDVSDTTQLVVLHLLYAATCAGLVWWGVREGHRMRINLGVLGFALTVLSFYFSSVLDKLGRSLGLIGLGVLFIGGGWLLERTRRRLVERSRELQA
jgi:uncharacterized membrane protein